MSTLPEVKAWMEWMDMFYKSYNCWSLGLLVNNQCVQLDSCSLETRLKPLVIVDDKKKSKTLPYDANKINGIAIQ